MSVGVLSFTLQAIGAGAIINQIKPVISLMKEFQDTAGFASKAVGAWGEQFKVKAKLADIALKGTQASLLKEKAAYATLSREVIVYTKNLQKLRAERDALNKRAADSLAKGNVAGHRDLLDQQKANQGKIRGNEFLLGVASRQKEVTGGKVADLSGDAKLQGKDKVVNNLTSAFANMGSKMMAVASKFSALIVTLVAATAAIVKIRKENLGLELSFSQTDRGMASVERSVTRVRESMAAYGITLKDGEAIVKSYNTLLRGTKTSYGDFAETVVKVQRATGQSSEEIASAIAEAASTGNIEKLKALGISYDKLQQYLKNFDTSNVETRMKTLRRLVEEMYGKGQEGYEGSFFTTLNRSWDAAVVFARAKAKQLEEIYDSFKNKDFGKGVRNYLRSLVPTSTGVEESQTTEEKKKDARAKYDQNLDAEKNRIKAQNTSLSEQVSLLGQMADKWGDIREKQFSIKRNIENLSLALKELSVGGNRFQTMSQQTSTAFSEAVDLSRGDMRMRKPEQAMSAFLRAGQMTAEAGNMSKSNIEGLTGINEFGVFTGNRARGRERYVLSETQKRLQEQTAGSAESQAQKLRENASSTADFDKAVKLTDAARALRGNDVGSGGEEAAKAVQDAFKQIGEVQTALAEEQGTKSLNKLDAIEKVLKEQVAYQLEAGNAIALSSLKLMEEYKSMPDAKKKELGVETANEINEMAARMKERDTALGRSERPGADSRASELDGSFKNDPNFRPPRESHSEVNTGTGPAEADKTKGADLSQVVGALIGIQNILLENSRPPVVDAASYSRA